MAKTPDILDLFRSKLAPSRQISIEGRVLINHINNADGWEPFLKSLGPNTFKSSFSEFHKEFWNWYWRLSRMRRDRAPIKKETLSFLAGWARGCGKSSTVEWACIAEGALGLEGYVLYVCKNQESANSHVADIRRRLESSEVARYFPDLAEPKIGRHGGKYGWRQDFLVTAGGWAIRPLGLDTLNIRGIREGDLRPTMIVFDDLDDYDMSLHEAQSILGTISRSILPAGTPSIIQLIAQNLIVEHGAVNQIYTGKTDVLSDHHPSVYPAFEDDLVIEPKTDPATGKRSYEILSGTPTWEGMDLEDALVNLNKSGLEAFYAEYQHDFSLDKSELVLPEYDDTVHVITWSQFEEMFGTRYRVPEHWQAGVGLDLGYTKTHLSAWTWMAVSAEDSKLPFAYFVYRGKTFQGRSLAEQVEEIDRLIKVRLPDGREFDERDQYIAMLMSHEKKGERMELQRYYDYNFGECNFKREDGLAQWRTLLRCDRRQPHPFHQDEIDTATGRYKLGRPGIFYVVEHDQLVVPRDDRGLMVHRAQISEWKRRKVKLTETGVQDALPMKANEDTCDSTRMLLSQDYLSATALSDLQRKRLRLQETIRSEDLTLKPGMRDYTGVLMRRQMELREIERQDEEEVAKVAKVVRQVMGLEPPPFVSRRR